MAGITYLWGGYDLNGSDCRGTVYYSYNQGGVNIPLKDAQGYYDSMKSISGNLKPGDIIAYWNPTPNENGEHITHIQVFIGDAIETKTGQFVHDAVLNAGSKDTGVYIVSLSRCLSWKEYANLTPCYGTLLK